MRMVNMVNSCSVWIAETEFDKEEFGNKQFAVYMPYQTPNTANGYIVFTTNNRIEALMFAKQFDTAFRLAAYSYLNSQAMLNSIVNRYLQNMNNTEYHKKN